MFDHTAFAALIKRRRGEMRLSQENLAAEALGDPGRKGDISKFENGKKQPQEATIQKLCTALNISDAEMEPIRQARPAFEQLANIPALSREDLQNLAARFGVESPYESSDDLLRKNLVKVADSVRRNETRIKELEETIAELSKQLENALDDKTEFGSSVASTLLSQVYELGRLQLIDLAIGFGFTSAEDASTDSLRAFLSFKANEYSLLKQEIDAIDDGLKRLSNLKAAAQDAINRVDLDEVELLLSRVQEVELEEAAKTAELRANNALLRGRVEQAYRILSAAADSFAAVDPIEPARKRILSYWAILRDHGLRYGGRGLPLSLDILDPVLTDALREMEPWLWAAGQDQCAMTLQEQGSRTDGPKGAALLAKAVAAYRAAFEVRSRADHPVHWAQTQNNLAAALQEQGKRSNGPRGAQLLADAVTAYHGALEVRTRADHPVHWAMTQNNLANALSDQGERTDGPQGAQLLTDAVTAYRAALEVRTRADHPVDWAQTQNNLGIALRNQGSRTDGPEGARLLAEAVTAYRLALEVRTRADHPVDWAATQENIAFALNDRALRLDTADAAGDLAAARAAVDGALEVYDPEHISYNHAKATRLREEILAAMAALAAK